MRQVIFFVFLVMALSALSGCSQKQLHTDFCSSFVNFFNRDPGERSPVSKDMTASPIRAEQIIQQARRDMSTAIANRWGMTELKMPDRKVWVSYNDDMEGRAIFDFENGEMWIEQLVEHESKQESAIKRAVHSLHKTAMKAVHDTPMDMVESDHLMHHARSIAKREGVNMPEPPLPPDPHTPVLQEVVFSHQVSKIPLNAIEMKPIVGEDGKKRTMMTYRIVFAKGYYAKLAARYADIVKRYAAAYRVPASLIFAIIEIESAFNPRATSPVPAYGLMQLVPKSGAADAYRYVYGESRIPDAEYLFLPENNIPLGTAYLGGVLKNKYLNAIKDDKSRELCAIAAYNTGAGNVARAFTGTTNVREAATVINQLKPHEVSAHLKSYLPYEETRIYLGKIERILKEEKYSVYDKDKDEEVVGGLL